MKSVASCHLPFGGSFSCVILRVTVLSKRNQPQCWLSHSSKWKEDDSNCKAWPWEQCYCCSSCLSFATTLFNLICDELLPTNVDNSIDSGVGLVTVWCVVWGSTVVYQATSSLFPGAGERWSGLIDSSQLLSPLYPVQCQH